MTGTCRCSAITVGVAAVTLGIASGLNGAPPRKTVAATPTSPRCNTPTTPFCNSQVALPQGWTGVRFALSQNYPRSIPNDRKPWLAVDPKREPERYARTVLDYFYEGNLRASIEQSFDPAQNKVRGWYGAPWLDFGITGREPIHGLTKERVSLAGELHPNQTEPWDNYATGFYNAAGGYMLGRVWANHGKPNAAMARAPEGTVAAKLLFTTAPVSQVPYLEGSPTWKAFVYTDDNNPNLPSPTDKRAVQDVRLLQIDIAVKDSRANSTTGWFFGTFIYGGGLTGKPGSGWRHVEPVGLMWGNDPGYSGVGELKETRLNPAVTMPHWGYQKRLNGPVDNPASSCLSCHSTAQAPESSNTLVNNLIPPPGADVSKWFTNIPSGTPFTPGKVSLDYSLQLAFGIANFRTAQSIAAETNRAKRAQKMKDAMGDGRTTARGGKQ
jgi:hypothetical protein